MPLWIVLGKGQHLDFFRPHRAELAPEGFDFMSWTWPSPVGFCRYLCICSNKLPQTCCETPGIGVEIRLAWFNRKNWKNVRLRCLFGFHVPTVDMSARSCHRPLPAQQLWELPQLVVLAQLQEPSPNQLQTTTAEIMSKKNWKNVKKR